MLKGDQAPAKPGGFFVTVASEADTSVKRVNGDILTVGRAADCNLILTDVSLSRRHLTIRLRDGVCYVEDHGSSNGTFINGKAVKGHVQIKLTPQDKVTMGEAKVTLTVSTELPPGQARTQARSDTIVTSTDITRTEQRQAQPAPPPKPSSEPQIQAHADVLLNEAQRKAAMMVQEAEMQAERRAQEIHRQAHVKKTETDEACQRRMNEAFRDSEKVYQKAQEDSMQILEAARHSAAEIRAQSEVFSGEMRQQAERECARILEEAQQTSRDLKEQRLLEANDVIKKKEEELLAATRDAMTAQLASFEADLSKEAARRRGEVQIELDGRRAKLELENLSLHESVAQLKAEMSQLTEQKSRSEKTRLETEIQIKKLDEEAHKLQAEIQGFKKTSSTLAQEVDHLRGEVPKLEKSRETLARLNEDIREAGARVQRAQEQADADLLQVRVRLQESKAKSEKDESARLDELKLQIARRGRELEVQMLRELYDKKDRMSREITLTVETFMKNNPDAKGRALKGLQEEISSLLDKQLVTASHDEGTKSKQATLVELKRREKWSTATIGVIMGCILALGARHIMDELEVNLSPMQRKVAAAQEARKLDLEQRKFNPPLSLDFKATYVENVVYTREFTQVYNAEDFQNKFMKALSSYMLKTWKTDEDKTIQLLGISSALVKLLSEKRANIHPDFEAQALEKMRQDESDATNRMRNLLGSQVRFEAFKKFEKEFYEKYTAVVR